MKAVICTKYGSPDVLQPVEIAKPTPSANEILVKIHATTVTAGDCRMRSFTVPPLQWLPARLFLGITKPKRPILGMELSGEIEAVGSGVKDFKPGDAVFASTTSAGFGGYAEYKCLPETGMLSLKPANMSHEEAAAVPVGGATAVRFLRKGNLQRGQSILIYGASGSVGTFAIQLAHYFGAEVTGVCSTANLELIRALGAEHVIDYTEADFTAGGTRYDLVFDAVGKAGKARSQKVLKPGGSFVSVLSSAKEIRVDLSFLRELIEAGKLRAIIDRRYSLAQIVDAHRYVDQGHKKGNVAVAI